MADGSSDRGPRGHTDPEWVGKLVVNFQLAARRSLPGSRPAIRYVSFPPGYSLKRLPEPTEVFLFLWCHDLSDTSDAQMCPTGFKVSPGGCKLSRHSVPQMETTLLEKGWRSWAREAGRR